MRQSDCSACHKVDEKSEGPSFAMIAQKYVRDENASQHLVLKVISGGSGVWGEMEMPPHSLLTGSAVNLIVQDLTARMGS